MSTEDFKQMVTPCDDPFPVGYDTQPEPAPSAADNAPTPRTDASLKSRNHLPNWFDDVVAADFARTLERELAASEAANRKASEDALLMRDALRAEVERLKAHEGDLVIGAAILNGARQQEAESVDQLRAALAAAQATAREAMEEADHYKRIFKSNGASMELMASRIPTGGQVIDAVIRAAAVTADSPGVLVWSANAAEQIEAALAKIAEEGQAQP